MKTRSKSLQERSDLALADTKEGSEPEDNVKSLAAHDVVQPKGSLLKSDANKRGGVSSKKGRVTLNAPGFSLGSGKPNDPFRIPLRATPNSSGCHHCPEGIHKCDCVEMMDAVWKRVDSQKKLRTSGHRENNAKSILPVFVTRLIRLLDIKSNDVFWDLGSGNGSVVMQVALQTGAQCVGVEIQEDNVALANALWPDVRSHWVAKHRNRKSGSVTFIAGDMFEAMRMARKEGGLGALPRPTKVWAANLLFSHEMNFYLGDELVKSESIASAALMKDIFPHARKSVAQKRNPAPYETFRMVDHLWQPGSVEWSDEEVQMFCVYYRVTSDARHDSGLLTTKELKPED